MRSAHNTKGRVLPDNHCPWGEEIVHLNISGLEYRISGLAPEQCPPITGRFGMDTGQPGTLRISIPIQAGYLDFEELGVEHYDRPGIGYAPLVELTDQGLLVNGLGFRGEIDLRPLIAGRLYTRSFEQTGTPFVVENFLRVITSYVALHAGGAYLHSSGIAVDGQAYLFLGHSGAGKTTVARMALALGLDILSDDGNLMLPDERGIFQAGPVPFAGELGQVSCKVKNAHPVAGLIWLQKGERVKVNRMSAATAYSRIIACIPTVNLDLREQERLDTLISSLLSDVPIYELTFFRDCGFQKIYDAIRKALV